MLFFVCFFLIILTEFKLTKNGGVYASLLSQAPSLHVQDTLQSITKKPHQMCHPHFSPRLCPFQTNHPTTACVAPLPAVQPPGGSGGRRLDMPQPETDAADRAYPSLQPWLLLLLTSRSEVHGEAGSAHWWRDACDRWAESWHAGTVQCRTLEEEWPLGAYGERNVQVTGSAQCWILPWADSWRSSHRAFCFPDHILQEVATSSVPGIFADAFRKKIRLNAKDF